MTPTAGNSEFHCWVRYGSAFLTADINVLGFYV